MPEISNETQNKNKRLGRGLNSLFGENMSSPILETPKPMQPKSPEQKTTQGPMPSVPRAPAHLAPKPVAAAPSTVVEMPPAPVAAAVATPIATENRIWNVAIDKLKPSPFQPRTQFEKPQLEELAQSIKSSGILQPIVARKSGASGFEIIAGERRWRAAQIAGLHEVPVILKEFNDRETLELALIENIQRQDLNPMEEAEAYQRLGDEFQLTQQQIAEKVGKERATVANAIRLLQLPLEVRDLISGNQLSVGHAKVLLSLSDPIEQKKWAQLVIKENIPVRKLEKLLKREGQDKKSAADGPGLGANVTERLINGLSEELQKILGTKVTIDYSGSKGKLAIHFYSDEQLTSLVERIREGCQK